MKELPAAVCGRQFFLRVSRKNPQKREKDGCHGEKMLL
jgi:hypothetical protein